MKANSPEPSRPILTIGITGGIASGKSYVCHQLAEAGHAVFYCDDEARQIIARDTAVRRELTALVGPGLYDREGRLVKQVLRDWLCRGDEYARQVNRIVHPRVAEAFRRREEQLTQALEAQALEATDDNRTGGDERISALAARMKHAADRQPPVVSIAELIALPVGHVLFMECALLFESGFDRLVDRSLLVHVSEATQVKRLLQRNGLTEPQAREWLKLQLSERERLARADAILPND